jgi:branched-chain amino acid transport system permease protein
VILGRLGNPVGPLLAGTVIGVSEALTMALTAPAWAPLVSFTLLILILLVRPDRV